MSGMSKNKRKCLTILDKIDIIRDLERGEKNVTVCKKYNLPSSTVSTFWKNKQIILSALENNLFTNKKIRKCERDDVDQALLKWFNKQRDAGFVINGPILRKQAEKLARQLGHMNFTCNNGWLDRFKNRHNIIYAKGNKKTFVTNTEPISKYTENVWLQLKQEFSEEESAVSIKLPPSYSEVWQALETLVSFFESTDTSEHVFSALSTIKESIRDVSVKSENQTIGNYIKQEVMD